MSVDLHRHDQFSRFDGYGQARDLAKLAKQLGHTALGTSNHGNTNGLVQTYDACKREGIKPILGVEGYFLPVYKEKEKGYHLCLFAKDLQGYRNLNAIQYEGEKQKYYNPIWTFELLEKYHEGLICTTACIGSYSSQCILKGKLDQAEKYLKRLKSIFGKDLYIEVQPYVVSDPGAQEKVNVEMIYLGQKLKIDCILTSDSHRGRKEDLDTYLKMHEMDHHDPAWVEGTYKERYMPELWEMEKRFVKMHGVEFGQKQAKAMAKQFHNNLERLESSVEEDILGQLPLQLPKVDSDKDSWTEIVRQCKEGLKKRGQYTKEYIKRCKEELDVIKANGFIDYFLIVSDYVNWAKSRGIAVGPGRGSVCNCLVAYAMHITDVDSIRFNLDFRRFMRYDKKAFPDIDLDFEMDRRGEVIEYLINKYPGQSARVSSYGLYKIDNTINELAKVCGLETDSSVDSETAKANKEVIKKIKRIVNGYKTEDGSLDEEGLFNGPNASEVKQLNRDYDNIITHFCRLFNKVRFIGTHAAGVILTSGDVLQYTALRIDKSGNLYSCYNLEDLNSINIIKFDLLGLKTMQSIAECRHLAGLDGFDINQVDNPELLEAFRTGNTCGIFQFEKDTAKRILDQINCDCFDDVVATCAMNRPGPLSMGMPEQYADNKANLDQVDKTDLRYQYTKESYGSVVYQEQLLLICVYIGGLEWNEADRVLKANKHGFKEKAVATLNKYAEDSGVDLHKKFVDNAVRSGMDREVAEGTWDSLLVYSFNKGHAAGYCIISMEEMFYKIYYPVYFWYAKIKYARDDKERDEFCNEAAKAGNVLFLPHVNYSKVDTSIRTIEGEEVLQQGLTQIKGVGEKAAQYILEERKKNGVFVSYDDFYDRCVGRVVNKRVLALLEEYGAIEFNKKTYIKRVTAYNTALYSRAHR